MKKIIIQLGIILMMSFNMQLSAQNLFFADTLTGCAPLTVHFTNISDDTVNHNFWWDFGDGPGYGGINAVHTFNTPGWYQVRLHEFTISGEFVRESNVEINVFGVSEIRSSQPESACLDEHVNFWVDGNYSALQWDLGDGEEGDNNWINHSYDSAGTYLITLIANTECGTDTLYKTIEISDAAVPDVTIYANSNNVCPNDVINFSTSFWSGNDYNWDFGDGNSSDEKEPKHSFSSYGVYDVVLMIMNICGNMGYDTMKVYVDSIGGQYSDFWYYFNEGGCPGNPVHFYASAGEANLWDFGDGTTSDDIEPSHVYGDTGTYSVMLIQTNGCGYTDTIYDVIHISYDNSNPPHVNFGFNDEKYDADTLIICPGQEVSFYNYYWDYNVDCHWSFGDGSTSEDIEPAHIFQNPGLFKVVMTGTNNCGASDSAYRYVLADPAVKPQSDLRILPSSICPGETVYFYDNEHYDKYPYTYSVWFGDGDSLTNIDTVQIEIPVLASHVYIAEGQYNYIFTVTNLCGNTDTVAGSINVSSNNISDSLSYYVANSTNQDSTQIHPACPGDKVSFYAVGGVSATWHFSDGYIDTNRITTHSFSANGVYNEYVVITTGCGESDTVYTLVTIDTTNIPHASFYSVSEGNCINSPVSFYYNNGDYGQDYTYSWDFGDGATSIEKEPVHQYQLPGNYHVTLTVTNGCGSSSTSNYYYYTGPAVSYVVTDASDCIAADGSITLNISQGQSPCTCIWNDSVVAPYLSNVIAGDYSLKVTDNAGCVAETSIHIGYPVKHSEISSSVCEGENVTVGNFIHNVTGTYVDTISDIHGCDSIVTLHLIVFPKDSTTVLHMICQGDSILIGSDYQGTQGVYTDHFINKHGCDSTVVTTLYVFHPEIISVTTDASDCAASDGSTDVTIINGVPPYDFSWSDGSYNEDLVSSVAGTYTLNVMDDLGCFAEKTITIGYHISQTDTTVTLCEGGEVMVGPSLYNTSGIYHDTLSTISGCDSIVILYLTVNPIDSIFHIMQICYGDSFFAGGLYQHNTGIYTDYYLNMNGCDSSYIIQLIVAEPLSAGNDTSYIICTDTGVIDLMQMLGGNPDQGGVWTDNDNSGALNGSLFNSLLVSAGTFNFTYTILDSLCGSTFSTLTLQVEICTGIDEMISQDVNIYPNPASDLIYVNNLQKDACLVISDITGRRVFSAILSDANTVVNLSSLKSGIYQLILNSGDDILFTEKLIIVK